MWNSFANLKSKGYICLSKSWHSYILHYVKFYLFTYWKQRKCHLDYIVELVLIICSFCILWMVRHIVFCGFARDFFLHLWIHVELGGSKLEVASDEIVLPDNIITCLSYCDQYYLTWWSFPHVDLKCRTEQRNMDGSGTQGPGLGNTDLNLFIETEVIYIILFFKFLKL